MVDRQTEQLEPREERACRLRAQGYSKAEAVRIAYRVSRLSRQRLHEKASRIFGRPQVQARVRDLLRATEKSDLLTHTEYLVSLQDDLSAAREAGNWTAAASFQRLIGQSIQALSDKIMIGDNRESDSAIIERLRQFDPQIADLAAKHLAAKSTFDA